MYFSKSIANGTKLLDAAIQIKVLPPALLDAEKMVPVLDAALISASKVFYVPAIIDVACSIVGCRQIGASIGCRFVSASKVF